MNKNEKKRVLRDDDFLRPSFWAHMQLSSKFN